MVVALRPLQVAAGLRRVVLTTFQSVSGAGASGLSALRGERNGEPGTESPFTRAIDGNVVPQIGAFDVEGWSEEERKMIHEPRKILGAPELRVSPTCVRVPVEVGHAVQMTVELERAMSLDEARAVLASAPGVQLSDRADAFPTPRDVAGRDDVFVGRLRQDPEAGDVLHLWVVADNLRKGAATNAVQIAELLRDE